VFGSDIPTAVASGIEAIRAAEFLTDEQKADILCLNATRFLRIAAGTCGP
jgi:predicted TIM-barrel fold metal-dependent hydrolase